MAHEKSSGTWAALTGLFKKYGSSDAPATPPRADAEHQELVRLADAALQHFAHVDELDIAGGNSRALDRRFDRDGAELGRRK